VITKIGSELGELGAKSWDAFKEGFPKGVGMVARGGPLVLLATAIAGPAGGIAASVAAFRPLSKLYNKVVGKKVSELTAHGTATIGIMGGGITDAVIRNNINITHERLDRHLPMIGNRLGVQLSRVGHRLEITGRSSDVEMAEVIIGFLSTETSKAPVSRTQVEATIRAAKAETKRIPLR
jgi:hypothetical protein